MSRRYCKHCHKPEAACLCRWIAPQDNRLPVLVLRHPDEQKHAIGTARLIELGLKLAKVETQLTFERQRITSQLQLWSVSRPLLIYPKSLSPDVPHFTLDFETEHFTPQTLLNQFDSLILLDGTWRNTRELLLNNEWLRTLPTLAIKHNTNSRYRIRQASQEGALATIEAVSEVLRVLDERFQAERFLLPFEKMIDYQIAKMGRDVYLKNYSQESGPDEADAT